MAKYDLNILQVDGETGKIAYKIRSAGSRAYGTRKVLQQWLKIFHDNSVLVLQGGSAKEIKIAVASLALATANTVLKQRQSALSLPDTETFVRCSMKSLDTNENSETLTLELEFETKAGSTVVAI